VKLQNVFNSVAQLHGVSVRDVSNIKTFWFGYYVFAKILSVTSTGTLCLFYFMKPVSNTEEIGCANRKHTQILANADVNRCLHLTISTICAYTSDFP